MFNDQQFPDSEFDDDGSGHLALIGVLVVVLVIIAGIALNASI